MLSPAQQLRPGSPCPVTGCAGIALAGYRFRVNGRSRAFCPTCGEKSGPADGGWPPSRPVLARRPSSLTER